jgi:preprotein translocase subunit SecF
MTGANFHFDFVRRWRIWFAFSGTLIVIALLSLAFRGLNYGIDFTGGTQMDLRFAHAVTDAQIHQALVSQNLGQSTVVFVGSGHREALITTPTISEAARTRLLGVLARQVAPFQAISTSRVSSLIGQQTEHTALLAVLLATVGIILYIAIRFEFRFAIAAIIALIHDVLITVGLIALIHLSLSEYFVMAVLTIFGYSVNDTIIIFDRIRENLQRQKRNEPLEDLVNRSLNQVLVRSINTSSTVLLALLAILIFGGSSIKDFATTMVLGVFFGTYSSIFIASPIWLLWRRRGSKGPAGRRAAAAVGR